MTQGVKGSSASKANPKKNKVTAEHSDPKPTPNAMTPTTAPAGSAASFSATTSATTTSAGSVPKTPTVAPQQQKKLFFGSLTEFSTFHVYFFVYVLFNVVGALVNHIDDTDETYGYWEPLHYLLYGKGMQTWEYSPEFALRSYTFIYPIYLLALQFKVVGFPKIQIFYAVRIFFGIFTAYAEASLIKALETTLSSPSVARITLIFLMTSPGVLFASTAYLPSAVAMSLLMLSYASWLNDNSTFAIFWGSVAVLWTGWPFVGVLFAPIGVHMLLRETKQKRTSRLPPSYFVTKLCISGVMIVLIVLIPSISIDFHYYHKWTLPTLNIFLYNAIGSANGDELYGVEPASYYFKNLFLNTGVAWPLMLCCPIVSALDFVITKRRDLDGYFLTILLSAALWLGVLFSRPHKEERFLYPAYPLIAYLAAVCIVSGVSILDRISTSIFGDNTPTNLHPEIAAYQKTKKLSKLAHIVSGAVSLVAVALAYGRVSANYRNYQGYLNLWRDTTFYLQQNEPTKQVTVCVGSEWYLFPTHFFLPDNAKIEYFEDGFHGILPAHFAAEDGTFATPAQPFNNMNKEEKSRYVTLDQCDFIVKSEDGSIVSSSKVLNDRDAVEPSNVCTINTYQPIHSRPVILSATAGKEWARAYDIPTVSSGYIQFKQYQLLKNSCNK